MRPRHNRHYARSADGHRCVVGREGVDGGAIFQDPGGEGLAVLCKATGLKRQYLRALWTALRRPEGGADFIRVSEAYETIAVAKAQTVLRYWNWSLSAAFSPEAAAGGDDIDVELSELGIEDVVPRCGLRQVAGFAGNFRRSGSNEMRVPAEEAASMTYLPGLLIALTAFWFALSGLTSPYFLGPPCVARPAGAVAAARLASSGAMHRPIIVPRCCSTRMADGRDREIQHRRDCRVLGPRHAIDPQCVT